MGKVIHGINTPAVTGLLMMRPFDSIDRRVPQVHIRRGHIYFGPQQAAAVGKLASAHTAKQVQVLFDRTIPERTIATRLGQRSPVFT